MPAPVVLKKPVTAAAKPTFGKIAPAKPRVPSTPPRLKPIPIAFANLLTEMETARLKKNAWAREFEAKQTLAKEMFEALERDAYTVQLAAEDTDGTSVPVDVTFEYVENAQIEKLDDAILKRLVTPAIYEKCRVTQKGLIEKNAGTAILEKCLVYETVPGKTLILTSKKVKGVKK